MKKILLLGMTCMLLSFISCNDDDNNLPGNEAEFLQAVEGIYYQMVDCPYLKADGDGWVEEEKDLLIFPGENFSNFVWFENGRVISEADLKSYSLESDWGLYLTDQGENFRLYVTSPFQYNASTKQFTSDEQLVGRESIGHKVYIEKATRKELVLLVELAYPTTTDGIEYGARRLYYSASKEASDKYRLFQTNDEAIDYVKEVLASEADVEGTD